MTDTPTPNIPLLRKAVEWVEAEAAKPEYEREWYQGRWVAPPRLREERAAEEGVQLEHPCGTAYCVAGWVATQIEGGTPTTDEDIYEVRDTSGRVREIPDVAAVSLGLTEEQSSRLFYPGNDAAQIRHLAERFAGEAL